MAQAPDVRRLLAAGRQLTEAGRSQAFQLRDGLVEQGRETTDQISAVIEKLLNPVGGSRDDYLYETVRAEVTDQLRAFEFRLTTRLAEGQFNADRIAALNKQRREHTDELHEVVRDEVQRQLTGRDVVTKEDLAELGQALLEDLRELERRLAPTRTPGNEEDSSAGRPLQMTPPHQRVIADTDPTGADDPRS